MKKGRLSCACTTMNLLAPSGKSIQRSMIYKRWKGVDFSAHLSGGNIWTDGTNIYYTEMSDHNGDYLGTDGLHYILKDGAWEPAIPMNWGEIKHFVCHDGAVWTDGTNIYCAMCYTNATGVDGNYHLVLNGDRWEEKTWSGLSDRLEFWGRNVWSDGENIYHSDNNGFHYILNGDTWEEKIWNGAPYLYGSGIWSDGENIYFNFSHILNGDTWEEKIWNYDGNFTLNEASSIWSDGENIFYSFDEDQYILDGDTWKPMTWRGFVSPRTAYFRSSDVWTDGNNYYVSTYDDSQYIFLPVAAKLYSRLYGEWVEVGAVT